METPLNQNTQQFVSNCLLMANDVLTLATGHTWIDYDKQADVLYMSFRKPQKSTETIEIDEDILMRKDGDEIVGITIMNASIQAKKH